MQRTSVPAHDDKASASSSMRLGVVLYRNSRGELERLVRSFEAARRGGDAPAFDVAWFDNSPSGELEGLVRSLCPDASYQHAQERSNIGFGAAHNRLMAQAFAEPGIRRYVCVNPDAALHPRCLRELVDEEERHARAGLVEARQFPDEHPKTYDPASHGTPWCSACVLLVTRALHAAIGGFDERFTMYCEDVDLSWRARAAGFAIAVAPRALAFHVATQRPHEQRMFTAMLRSGYLLGVKYGDDRFSARCADELRRRGAAVPDAAGGPPASDVERAAADLTHGFVFAEGRW